MNPIVYWSAVTLGSVIGALRDPLIWTLIALTAASSVSTRFRWWHPAAIAIAFNVVHIWNVLPYWRMLGLYESWMGQAVWQLVVKLLIAYPVAYIGVFARRLWDRSGQSFQ